MIFEKKKTPKEKPSAPLTSARLPLSYENGSPKTSPFKSPAKKEIKIKQKKNKEKSPANSLDGGQSAHAQKPRWSRAFPTVARSPVFD